MTRIPHAVDRHVGQRLRLRRLVCDLSQGALAKSCRITFQQVQKYEKGANRISASRLQEFGKALGVPVSFFFEGLPADGSVPNNQALLEGAFLATREGVEIARAWPHLADEARNSVLNIVRALAAGTTARAA